MKITGAKAQVYFGGYDENNVIAYNSGVPVQTEADKWYRIMGKGDGSDLPLREGNFFKAPSGAEQITLVSGDSIMPLDPERFCKTSASLSAEEGTVEVGDDCDPGATILDGIVNISGSLAGLFRYDEITGEFDSVTDEVLSKFFSMVNDNAGGIYEYRERENKPVFLMVCLNSNAAVGQVENWLIVPIIISSASVNLGNTDAQNKDLSWAKAEGDAVIYRRVKTAA